MEATPSFSDMRHGIRKSHISLNEVYFWTDTIKDWRNLLANDRHKEIIMKCWQELVSRKKIVVYAFVVMPNHLHVIWEMVEQNGKEMPHASFNKFTSHQFLVSLRGNDSGELFNFIELNSNERKHRFWQRDPLAVLMDSQEKIEQKVRYIHFSPLQEKWNLVSRPENYRWSSAKFYETGVDELGILTHFGERF